MFPVVGTSVGVDIRRSEVLAPSGVMAPPTEASCSTTTTAHPRPHKRRLEAFSISSESRRSPVSGAMKKQRGAMRSC